MKKNITTHPAFQLIEKESKSGNERDWTEDFHLENGNYQNVCLVCKNLYNGYKRRHTCKKCATEATIEFKAQQHCIDNKIESGSPMFILGAKFAETVYQEQITILKEQIIELATKPSQPLTKH